MRIEIGEFMRRFLLHVLPNGFHRIRHYGLLANGHRADNSQFAEACQRLKRRRIVGTIMTTIHATPNTNHRLANAAVAA